MKNNWNALIISNGGEAEVATEFGDGTIFSKGDVVLHNHRTGRYKSSEALNSAKQFSELAAA